jgi:hypothetical protein
MLYESDEVLLMNITMCEKGFKSVCRQVVHLIFATELHGVLVQNHGSILWASSQLGISKAVVVICVNTLIDTLVDIMLHLYLLVSGSEQCSNKYSHTCKNFEYFLWLIWRFEISVSLCRVFLLTYLIINRYHISVLIQLYHAFFFTTVKWNSHTFEPPGLFYVYVCFKTITVTN